MNQKLANDLENVLKKVQLCKSAHQKNLKVLEGLYQKVEHEEFIEVLQNYLKNRILPIKNEWAERILVFLSQFVASMASSNEDIENIDEDTPSHPFLREIVVGTLKYHNVINESIRYNSCLFVRLILQHIGHQTHLDNDVCDFIQDAMLERTLDPKSSIRHQAVLALIRLQEPINPECPVIKAYLSLIIDGNPLIRAEVVKGIAPIPQTIPSIINRLRDIDVNVRINSLRRCADLGPRHFKIVERQYIMKCGLSETQQKVKTVFVDNLLMKWLNVYNGNFIEFLRSVKLDADENDIINTEEISKEILKLLFESVPITDVISFLPLDNKLIPIENLTSEGVTLWSTTTNYLRKSDTMEEYLNDVLPELTPFCEYINSVVDKKNQTIPMAEWEFLDYQYILFNLFEIVEQYDLSDEVGRKRLNELVLILLRDEELQFRILKKVIALAVRLKSEKDDIISIVCHLISEIREPLIEKTVAPIEPPPNHSFDKAQLKVKINVLEAQLEDATDMKEFLQANSLKEEITQLKQQLRELMEPPPPTVELVKVSKDDPKTVCRCLDILIALLQLPCVTTLTPYLVAVKDEFVLPLLNNNVSEINWRVLNCLGLFCLLSEALAEEYIRILSIPIITYRAIPNYDKLALTVAVKAMSDLFRVHSVKILGSNVEASLPSSANQTKRRLYRNDDEDSVVDPNRFHFESAIEIILDMLDDENAEIQNCAVEAISKLILDNFPVTPPYITRIVLKWYNPLTARTSDHLQQILGALVANYANSVKGAKEVVSKAVIPILTSIASAPKTSPLVDVDVDNMLGFLAAITNCGSKSDLVHTHLNLARMLCNEIQKKQESPVILYLAKMLVHLDLTYETIGIRFLKELIAEVQVFLEEEGVDKLPKKYLTKFITKLSGSLEEATTNLTTVNEESEEANEEENRQEDVIPVVSQEESSDEREENAVSKNNQPEIEIEKEVESSSETTLQSGGDKDADNLELSSDRIKINKGNTQKKTNTKNLHGKDNGGNSKENERKDKENSKLKRGRRPNKNVSSESENNTTDSELETQVRKKRKNNLTPVSNTRSRNKVTTEVVDSDKTSTDDSNDTVKTKNKRDHPKKLQAQKDTKKVDKKTEKDLKIVVNNRKNDEEIEIWRKKTPRKVPESNTPTSNKENNTNNTEREMVPRTKRTPRVRINLTRLDSQLINEKKKKKKENENLGKSDSDTDSPKRKKAKKVTLNITNVDIAKGNKTDGTMSFSNFTINSSLKHPIAESTVNSNGILARSSLNNNKAKNANLSKRNSTSNYTSENLDTSEETILHTLLEESSRMSRLSIESSRSSFSERTLRSRHTSVSGTPSSKGSPVIRMLPKRTTRSTSEYSPFAETGSQNKRTTNKSKRNANC